MKRYIAFLRGVNISGKNKVPMTRLKNEFEKLEYKEVKTYLNSGNVIFSSDKNNIKSITKQIVTIIKKQFSLDIPIFVIEKEELEDILRNAPDWWGNKDKEIYYHTDSRWTTLGASLVWQQIASDLGLDTSKAPALKPYVVTGDFSGNLSRTSGFESGYREPIYAYLTENASDNTQMVASYESEGIKTAELYDRTKLDEPDAYEVFLGGDYDKIDIRTTADSTDRLLLVKDSFADCMIPFLIPYYREIIVVDADYYQKHVSDLLDKNKITSVLFLYDCNHFVQDDKLSSILTTDKAE